VESDQFEGSLRGQRSMLDKFLQFFFRGTTQHWF
jgi:hypothetical protein